MSSILSSRSYSSDQYAAGVALSFLFLSFTSSHHVADIFSQIKSKLIIIIERVVISYPIEFPSPISIEHYSSYVRVPLRTLRLLKFESATTTIWWTQYQRHWKAESLETNVEKSCRNKVKTNEIFSVDIEQASSIRTV